MSNTASDTVTLESLWLSVAPLCRMWARQYVGASPTNHYDIDDLLQAAFLAVYDTAEQHDPERGSFNTLLRYHCRSRFAEVSGHRGTKRRPEYEALSLDRQLDSESDMSLLDTIQDPDAEFEESTVERVYTDELRAALDECLERLTPEQADTLRARYYDSRSYSDIATERDVTPDVVRREESNGLRNMRRGKNHTRLKAWREDIISRSYQFSGYKTFMYSGYSSVEYAAERLIEKEAALFESENTAPKPNTV